MPQRRQRIAIGEWAGHVQRCGQLARLAGGHNILGLFDPPNPRAERFGHIFSLDAVFAQLYCG
jgi:hypothetical protein